MLKLDWHEIVRRADAKRVAEVARAFGIALRGCQQRAELDDLVGEKIRIVGD